MITEETDFIKTKMSLLGRGKKLELLNSSNLTDREIELLSKRFVNGLSIKECSEYFGLEENTISKNQLKATKKLFLFLNQQNIHK